MKSLNTIIQEKTLLYRISVHKDADAYATMYDVYVEKIYRFVFFKVNNTQEAEDITSDVFLKVWQYLISEKGKSVSHLSGLLYRTARNCIIDTYRERAKKPTTSLDQAEQLPDESHKHDIHIKEEYRQLLASLTSLKQEYQDVLLLRYVEEMSMSEICRILEKKPSAVRVLLHRATKKLQELHHI